MPDWIMDFVRWIVELVETWGYLGIFVMTMLESTFVPIPSEITMIPAGYLAYQGKMHAIPVLLAAISGTIVGALLNYYLAIKLGRTMILRYGKYFFIKPETLDKVEHFFVTHGAFSTFTGRLVPGVRHFISFPAGLARMPLSKFCAYTGLGGGLWVTVLFCVGYFIGHNEELIGRYMPYVKIGIILVCVLSIGFYIYRHRRKQKKAA